MKRVASLERVPGRYVVAAVGIKRRAIECGTSGRSCRRLSRQIDKSQSHERQQPQGAARDGLRRV